MAEQRRPLPPPPAPHRSCASGDHPSTGWRWYVGLARWERACDAHRGGRRAVDRGVFVPDFANVEREDPGTGTTDGGNR